MGKEYDYFGCSRGYKIFKKLPIIFAISTAICFFVWSIVDVCVFEEEYSYRHLWGEYEYEYEYGIMGLSSRGLVLFIWWLIGAVVSFIEWGVTTVVISPIIIKTEAICAIEKTCVRIKGSLLENNNDKNDVNGNDVDVHNC